MAGRGKVSASKLRDARVALGLTQDELAKKADIPYRTVQSAEAGTQPQRGTLDKLLPALGVTLEDVLLDPPAAEAEPVDQGWDPDIRTMLNVVGLWLEQVYGAERRKRMDWLLAGIIPRSDK